jgi:hypothetical protein
MICVIIHKKQIVAEGRMLDKNGTKRHETFEENARIEGEL